MNFAKALSKYLLDKSLSNKSFVESMGWPKSDNSKVSRYLKGENVPYPKTITKILKVHPDLKKYIDAENGASVVSNGKIKYIPLVSQYAYAGYLNSYSDDEYIEDLPTIPFLSDRLEMKGTYLWFEVKGDSMLSSNDEEKSIEEGDLLLGREIQRHLWTSKLHIKQWYFIIVHRTEGILVKKIIDHNINTGDITIHSLNDMYPDQVLNLDDIIQIFNVVQRQQSMKL